MFREDPTAITFNSSLPPFTTAADIRTATKLVVYDSLLHWHIGEYDSLMSAACITSVPDLYATSPIQVFPNPFSTHTTLRTGTTFHNATLSIVNSLGQQVQQMADLFRAIPSPCTVAISPADSTSCASPKAGKHSLVG